MSILGILITPVTEIGKCLFIPLKREINLVIHYKKNIKNLSRHANYLESRREYVQGLMDEARCRSEEPTPEVLNWLESVDEVQADKRRLDDAVKDNKRCFKGWCLDWRRHRRLSREAEWKLVIVMELQERGNFTRVSYDLPPTTIESFPVGDFEAFESTESAMNQIMDALEVDGIHIIGVYGMGGVGKTTLMKEVGRRLKRKKVFEVVLMVTISQKPELKKIQNEIAEKLGLKLHEDSESVRASRILKRMRSEKSILVILDGLWEGLELCDLGIPFGVDHKGCKIVLTARSLDVCNVMDSQANIAVELLNKEDSWKLFKRKAGDGVESPTLFQVAHDVVEECGGLPLAIVTLGRALRQKTLPFWANTLIQLKRSIPTNIDGMNEKVFSSLMLSYNCLETEEIKLCFLFCCLFPDDYNIRMDKLTRYVMGEGFLRDVSTLEEASRKVHDLVDKLKASCLLLNGDEEGYTKMHDVVRDAAISISSNDCQGFLVKIGQRLREWPEREELERCKRISLVNNRISTLPSHAECPELLTLLMQNNWSLNRIPESFFEGMKSLRVLDLNNTSISSLPPSLASLTNLRTLCL